MQIKYQKGAGTKRHTCLVGMGIVHFSYEKMLIELL